MNESYTNLLKSFDAFCFNLSGKKEFVDEILKVREKFNIRKGGYFYDPTLPDENKKKYQKIKEYGNKFTQSIENLLNKFNMQGMYPIMESWVLFNDPTIPLQEGVFHFTKKVDLNELKEKLNQCDTIEECKSLITETFQYYPDAFMYVPQLSPSRLAEVLSSGHTEVYKQHKKNNPLEGQKHIKEKDIKKLRQLLYASSYNKTHKSRDYIIEDDDGNTYTAKTSPLNLSAQKLIHLRNKIGLKIDVFLGKKKIDKNFTVPDIGIIDKDVMGKKLRDFSEAEEQRKRLKKR